MSRFERNLLGLLVMTAVVLWAVVAFKVGQASQEPLGPQLALPTYTSPPLSMASLTPRPTAGPTTTLIPGAATITPYVAPQNNLPACGGPAKMTLLAIG